ncbi:hypothetical protein HanRHA438_Chr13g0616021 [Helianthus annuus]|uniref:Uncharacterized protein n=1 Tax=Helianthus annuus TaxID=4232 RepID=A0A251SYU5_HELAN|nr:hypothetical protein HanXRQr2_Chr13g0605581 [Helianthus annuus]KAJ0478114.1 hypothetical protein HanHA300_Chr13g0496561 [Helianthus annuus]KAJ0482785.1 hypothetical protein HanIR_Chr13g0657721 [Helianthus annuus]KAJ0498996.1 hypothetical protein HanHA89_Chr13g0529211 [Helianthus annuus]KAJ0665010.1 hypothetical protein HanLR1_Chr13g0499241 [Helianthus annuus]
MHDVIISSHISFLSSFCSSYPHNTQHTTQTLDRDKVRERNAMVKVRVHCLRPAIRLTSSPPQVRVATENKNLRERKNGRY